MIQLYWRSLRSARVDNQLTKFFISAAIYNMWKERHSRINSAQPKTAFDVQERIKVCIRDTVSLFFKIEVGVIKALF